MLFVSTEALTSGFVNSLVGSHTSRTIMLRELRVLLGTCARHATPEDYRQAVIDDNVLQKGTVTTRRASLRQLQELYALDPQVLLFRALRDLWDADEDAQPLLALLCAVARDPLLRATAETVLSTSPGEAVTPEMLATAVDMAFPGHYKPTVLHVIGRNTVSSWQQSGHLAGRTHKVRSRAKSRPVAVAYALLLGHLCGASGNALFQTLWARLLDAPEHILRSQAATASQAGWIDYRHAGGMTEVGFRYLLRDITSEGARA